MSHWTDELEERTVKEIAFARSYVNAFDHGTDGHHRLQIIAMLADALDRVYMNLDRLESDNRPALPDSDSLPQNERPFSSLLHLIPLKDIKWLLSETLVSIQFPVENAPESLLQHGLVDRSMISSGRNPKYGFQVNPLGSAFAMWIRSRAVIEFLHSKKTHVADFTPDE